ncbi:MAG: hypothetical protein C4308_03410 [Chitinophagaceae bacterium]
MTRVHRKLKETTERKYDIVFNLAVTDIDTVEIKIPEGYTPEAVPQEMKLQTRFGKYSSQTKIEKDKIVYYRW